MSKKFFPLIIGVIITLAVGGYLIFNKGKGKDGEYKMPQGLKTQASKMSCQTDADCVCGVDKETRECAFGNKNFIDTSKQCPDFCTGFVGKIKIKCIGNLCTQKLEGN